MHHLKLTTVAAASGPPVILGKRRLFAATVAIAFPIALVAILVVGLVENGLESLLVHSVLLVTIVPGAAAFWLWCKRYTAPALSAFTHPSPVLLHSDFLQVNDRKFPITEHLEIAYDNRSRLAVRDGNDTLAQFPSYFIRIDGNPVSRPANA